MTEVQISNYDNKYQWIKLPIDSHMEHNYFNSAVFNRHCEYVVVKQESSCTITNIENNDIKHKLLEVQKEFGINTTVIGIFNTPLSVLGRSSR